MDNKKWYNRFATIFWWCITIFPLIVLVIGFIGSAIVSFDSINNISINDVISYYQNWFDNIACNSVIWNSVADFFNGLSMPVLTSAFTNLFDLFGLTSNDVLGVIFGYMVSIQVYHVLFDFVVWLPHLVHNLMDRWC